MRTISSFHMVGILGSHPEQLSGEGKASYVRLSISQDTRDGDSRWAKVFAFEKTADIALSYARKGAEIYVQGHLEPRTMEVNGKTISVIAAVANRLEVLRPSAPGADTAAAGGK